MFSKTWSPFWQPHKPFRSIFLEPLPFPDAEDISSFYGRRGRMLGAGNGRRWRTAGGGEWHAPENGRCSRMACAGEWQALESAGAGEWQVLENGRRWRMAEWL